MGQRGVDLSVPGPGPRGHACPGGRGGLLRGWPGFRRLWLFLQAGAVAGDGALDGFGQVVPQVPPVGDLDGQRRAFGCAFCIASAAVAADDLDTRVGVQPGAEGFGRAFGEHVHWPAGLDVHQDRAVDVPLAQREIIHTQHQRNPRIGVGSGADEPKQRRAAG